MPRPSTDERLINEASAWFSRLNTRSVSAKTLEGFREWRQGPGHREAYAEVERAWRRTSMLQGDAHAEDAVTEALQRANARRTRPAAMPWGRVALVAATLLLVTTLGVGAATRSGLMGPRYSTGVGEQRLVQLADGSRVRLDTDTRVAVRFSGERRLVRLQRGQAMFDVAHDAHRPFIVEAGAADVRALGTRFDVRRDAGHVRVTLVEGRVEVRPTGGAPTAAVILRPGEQVFANGGLSHPRPADISAATSWVDGRLLFHAIPLRQAVAEMNRYSRRRIVLTAPDVADETVSGAFDTGNVDGFVSAVSRLHGLRTENDDKEIRLLSETS